MIAILHLINAIVHFYQVILIAQVIMSWLLAFGAVDRYNRVVVTIADTLNRLTEPVLQPIRNLLYRVGLTLGGLDLSPLIAFFLLGFIRDLLFELLLPATSFIP